MWLRRLLVAGPLDPRRARAVQLWPHDDWARWTAAMLTVPGAVLGRMAVPPQRAGPRPGPRRQHGHPDRDGHAGRVRSCRRSSCSSVRPEAFGAPPPFDMAALDRRLPRARPVVRGAGQGPGVAGDPCARSSWARRRPAWSTRPTGPPSDSCRSTAVRVGDARACAAGRQGPGRRRRRRRRVGDRRVDAHRRVGPRRQGRRRPRRRRHGQPSGCAHRAGDRASARTPRSPRSCGSSRRRRAHRRRCSGWPTASPGVFVPAVVVIALVTFAGWWLVAGDAGRGPARGGRRAHHRLPVRPRPGHAHGDHGRHRPGRRGWACSSRAARCWSGRGASTPSCSTRPARSPRARWRSIDVVPADGRRLERTARPGRGGGGRVGAPDRATPSSTPRTHRVLVRDGATGFEAVAGPWCARHRRRHDRARRAAEADAPTRGLVLPTLRSKRRPRSSRRKGHTAVLVGWDGEVRGVLAVADTLKDGAAGCGRRARGDGRRSADDHRRQRGAPPRRSPPRRASNGCSPRCCRRARSTRSPAARPRARSSPWSATA